MEALYSSGLKKKLLPATPQKMHNSLPAKSFSRKDDQRRSRHGPLALNGKLNDHADNLIILP
jgi:hypothetical protein